jgi:hypothetical protein
LQSTLQKIDAQTARAFVTAARHVIDALLIEGERLRQGQPPPPQNYATATLPSATPAGGWLADEELRATARKLAEAAALERWTDGLLSALRLCAWLGGVL